jgi:hypothetical protein
MSTRHAVTGDLSQFYNSLKLKTEYFNLQSFLWRMNLDETDETLQAVIVTLMYGVKSVSAQSEGAMIGLAKDFQTLYPALAELLLTGRCVDDMSASMATMEELKQRVRDAEVVFEMVDISCKGWTFDGEDPPEEVSGGEPSIGVEGLTWFPMIDVVCVAIPRLHFGRMRCMRLDEDVPQFSGGFAMLDGLVPSKLSLRQVVSKVASVFDLGGLLAPVLASLRVDIRRTTKAVETCDEAVPEELWQKWIHNFWLLEQLRGLGFQRAMMPEDALNDHARGISLIDAALEICMMGIWIGFQLITGGWSCQLLIARSALADENSTIPKNELQAGQWPR